MCTTVVIVLKRVSEDADGAFPSACQNADGCLHSCGTSDKTVPEVPVHAALVGGWSLRTFRALLQKVSVIVVLKSGCLIPQLEKSSPSLPAIRLGSSPSLFGRLQLMLSSFDQRDKRSHLTRRLRHIYKKTEVLLHLTVCEAEF